MQRALTLVLVLVAGTVPAALVAACSSSSGGSDTNPPSCGAGGADGGACTAHVTVAYTSCATDLMSPTVSFAKDVQPTFNASCGIAGATCHGNPNNSGTTNGQVFLGIPDGGVDAAQVLGAIVGKMAPEDPSLQIVAAGNPEQSYLMHKLDDDQCLFASECNATNNSIFANCGLGMPYSSPVLDPSLRDTIRRWIAQGAQNN